ncbi:MAG: hypothetical protein ABSH09_02025 [Bryobacteraceae bacterium]
MDEIEGRFLEKGGPGCLSAGQAKDLVGIQTKCLDIPETNDYKGSSEQEKDGSGDTGARLGFNGRQNCLKVYRDR